MKTKEITFKKINQYSNNVLFQASNGIKTIPFNAELKKDRIGSLYCVECSICGYFEEYGLKAVKERISKLF